MFSYSYQPQVLVLGCIQTFVSEPLQIKVGDVDLLPECQHALFEVLVEFESLRVTINSQEDIFEIVQIFQFICHK